MTANEIREKMEEYAWEYEKVAIRTQEEPFELGPIDHLSHVWVDGDDTGEELDGICGTTVEGVEQHIGPYGYIGDHMAIIAGNSYEYGEDAHEVIIRDAVVVEVLK